jgi:hypothetical protein
MDLDVVVFVIAAALILAGGAAVIWRELTSQKQRNVRRPWEDAVHVVLPGVGLIVLLWASWNAFR